MQRKTCSSIRMPSSSLSSKRANFFTVASFLFLTRSICSASFRSRNALRKEKHTDNYVCRKGLGTSHLQEARRKLCSLAQRSGRRLCPKFQATCTHGLKDNVNRSFTFRGGFWDCIRTFMATTFEYWRATCSLPSTNVFYY